MKEMDVKTDTSSEETGKDRCQSPSDVESQLFEDENRQDPLPVKPAGLEYAISTKVKFLYLGIYFFLNLSLTIYNKTVLGRVCSPKSSTYWPARQLT